MNVLGELDSILQEVLVVDFVDDVLICYLTLDELDEPLDVL